MSINMVVLLGRLSSDVEVKNTPSGLAVANFSIATSEKYKDKSGEMQEKTEFTRIVVWGKLAELCGEYLAKGRQAYISGKLQTRSYEDKDGVKKYITEVVANTVQFLGGSESKQSTEALKPEVLPSKAKAKEMFQATFSSEDIPF